MSDRPAPNAYASVPFVQSTIRVEQVLALVSWLIMLEKSAGPMVQTRALAAAAAAARIWFPSLVVVGLASLGLP